MVVMASPHSACGASRCILVLAAPWRAFVEPGDARGADDVRPILAQAVSPGHVNDAISRNN
jgi:hypothetical protein